MEAQHKLNGLGLPRQWKVITSTLLLLFTFAIGNVWAADIIVQVGNVDAVTDKDSVYAAGNLSDGITARHLYVKSNGTYTSTDIKNTTGIAVLYGNASTTSAKMSSTSNLGPKLVSGGKTHLQVGVEVGDSVTIYWFHNSTFSNKTMTVSKVNPENAANGVKVVDVTGMTLGTSKRTGCTGWKSTISGTAYFAFNNTLYVYAIKVTPKPSATNYTVTIDPNGGSYAETPDGWTYSAGVYTKSIASGTSFTAPEGLTNGTDDLSWKDGSDNDVTFPVSITGDITFVAQWAPHTASSDATLSALSVAGCTLNETFDPATTAYTITLPFYRAMPVVGDVTATKNDSNAEDPEVSISSNVITIHCEAEDGTTTKDYTITVTIAPAPASSSSINIEQLVLDNGKSYDIVSALTAANIVTDGRNGLDSLNDVGKTNRNYAYLGLKLKKANADIIKIVVPAEKALNVKFGNVGVALTTTINGVAGSNVAKKTDGYSSTFHLDAAAVVREVVFHSSENQTVTLQQVKIDADVDPITLPWLVTYDAGEHGTCATAKQTWTGTALTLPAVTPESGWNFEGWNDDEDNPVSSPYTPTKNVTLTAQYTAQASPYDLTSLTYKIGTGAATNVGYTDGTYTYNIVLPYKASYDAITVTPVLKEATSYLKGDEVLTVSSLPGAATFTVVEAGGASEQLYTINFSKAAKDGTSIFKAELTSPTAATYSGLYVDDENSQIALSNDGGKYKFAGTSNFIKMALTGGTFATNDKLTMTYSANPQQGELAIYDNTDKVAGTAFENNTLDFPAGANGLSTLYIRRTDANKFNGWVLVAEVTRVINPVLKAITFAGVDATVNEGAKTVTVTVPNATDLGTMAVVPTIYRNAPHATTPEAVISNAGDWIEGDNTYRVMDKDGDYTDYTITLTRDVLKHTVSFNTHGGSTIDPIEVVDGGYLAPAQVPEDPTKDDYIFQGWAETEDGAEVDITTVQINADKTFHAVWEAEPAGIKLINGDVVNHTNFLTGTNETTIEIESVEHKCVDFTTAGSNRTTVASIADLKEFIQYNATTNKAKIKLTLYNTRSSAVSAYLHMLEEGSETPTTEEISIPAGEVLKTDFYEFNSEKNRSFYITCGNRNYIKVLQVKVIDDGTTTLKKAGQVGYSVNTLKSRIFAPQQSAISFEGLTINANAVCKPLSTTALKIKNAYNISFHADAAMTLAVTTEGSQTYYVSTTADGTANETSFTGRKEFNITAGDWYIHAGGSELKVAKLEFSLPKAEEPTITTQPASNHTFGPGNLTAMVVAEVSDGGTLSYQWYDASDDSEVAGATSATLTTTTEGTYYVIVTNSLAGHQDNSIKSDEATLAYRDASDATLSALSVSNGTLAPTFDPAELNYRVDLPEGTVDVPTLTATATMAGFADVVIFNEGSFTNYEAVSTVTVTSEDLSDTKVYTVHFYVAHAIATLVDVTENTTWDWSLVTKKKDGTIIDGNGPIVTEAEDGLVIANYLLGENWDKIEGNNGAYAIRNSTDKKVYQGANLHIHTTKGGYLSIWAANEGHTMTLNVNNAGRDMELATLTGSQVEYKVYVQAGDVTIHNVPASGTSPMRVSKMIFTVDETPDYTRDEMLGNGVYGTICVPYNVPAGGIHGITVYELMGRESQYGKLAFDEIIEMEAGVPYVFQAHGDELALYYGETSVAAPVDKDNGMYGTFTDQELTELNDVYYFAQKALWSCADLDSLNVPANRAYVKLSEVGPVADPNPAPGRRRISMAVNGEQVATGFENVQGDNVQCTKVLINGQLFILRGEKMYDAKGQLVK